MANASWIYGDLVGLGVGILCVLDIRRICRRFTRAISWTKATDHWTRAQLTLSSKGFRATGPCKTPISASAQPLAGFASKLDANRDRFPREAAESAVSYELGLRHSGEDRFVPHAPLGPTKLKPTQQRAVASLNADPVSTLTRGQYEKLTGVSRSQAAYDLAELVEAGILERVGNGRATRYRLARGGGTQRHWTNDRIHRELEAFCADRQTWPSAAEFKATGRGDLYVAASRYGGIAHWAEALGFVRSVAIVAETPQPSPRLAKLKWAGAGALAALGIAAAGGAILINLDSHGSSSARAVQAPEVVSERMTDESLHSVPATARKARTRPVSRTLRQAPKARRHRAHASPAEASSAPAHTIATSGVSETRSFSAYTPASPSRPAPLPAPSGGSAPPPLKAP
jgi:hypothetical protein